MAAFGNENMSTPSAILVLLVFFNLEMLLWFANGTMLRKFTSSNSQNELIVMLDTSGLAVMANIANKPRQTGLNGLVLFSTVLWC